MHTYVTLQIYTPVGTTYNLHTLTILKKAMVHVSHEDRGTNLEWKDCVVSSQRQPSIKASYSLESCFMCVQIGFQTGQEREVNTLIITIYYYYIIYICYYQCCMQK